MALLTEMKHLALTKAGNLVLTKAGNSVLTSSVFPRLAGNLSLLEHVCSPHEAFFTYTASADICICPKNGDHKHRIRRYAEP